MLLEVEIKYAKPWLPQWAQFCISAIPDQDKKKTKIPISIRAWIGYYLVSDLNSELITCVLQAVAFPYICPSL